MHEPTTTNPEAKPAKSEYRRKLPHVQKPDRAMFVTFNTKERMVLPEAVRANVLAHCLYDHQRRYHLHVAVVMPDHVHLLFTPLRDDNGDHFGFVEIMRGLKGASARTTNALLGRKGPLWQQESFDRVVRLSEGVRRTAEYICQNPIRAGLVSAEGEYRWLWREWAEGVAP